MAKKHDASYWLFLFAGIIVVVLIALVITRGQAPGQYDELAECLTDKDVKMFGTYWCPNCSAQKDLFGPSFSKIDYKECSPQNQRSFALCELDNIKAVPTWEFGDGTRVQGVQSLESLAAKAGCSLSGKETGVIDDFAVSDSENASAPEIEAVVVEDGDTSPVEVLDVTVE